MKPGGFVPTHFFSTPLILAGVITVSSLFFYVLDEHLLRKKMHAKLFKLKAGRK